MFGILNLNKPAGMTSRDVVNRIARIVRPEKAGHAGTLDPLATGVLLVCVGPATRLVPLIHEHSKTYEAAFLLGKTSPTDDIDGEVTDVDLRQPITRADMERLLPEFLGVIQQLPPQYSAVKVKGQRAYALARRGEEVELKPRPVHIHKLRLTQFDFPEFRLSIECGTGTYVRSIGRDLAQRLGTSAVMTELVRTRIGPFTLNDAINLDQLDNDSLNNLLIPPQQALTHLPQLTVNDEDAHRLRCGQWIPRPVDQVPAESNLCILGPEETLVGIASVVKGRLAPQIIFPMKQ